MELSYFYDSVKSADGTYDREYDADDFAKVMAMLISNGIYVNPSTNSQIIANNAFVITEKPGMAWINGRPYLNTNDLNITVDIPDGELDRIDLVVLQLDYKSRLISCKVKKGEYSSSPVAPSVQRDADSYELAIAEISVPHGTTALSQLNITDTRLDTTRCGVIHGLIEQVDTTTLFNQFTQGFIQKEEDFVKQFVEWFDSIKNHLGTDAAGHLQLQINDINDLDTASLVKSEKDDCGIFTKLEYKDKFGTVLKTSVLSGGVSPLYTTRTVTYRKGTVIKYSLTYDDDNDLLSEVIVNE